MARSAAISVRVEAHVKEAVERAAKDDRRTVAALVEMVLVEYLVERGYLEPGVAE